MRGLGPSTSPRRAELFESLPELREQRSGGDRRDDRVRQLPAELLADLERERLRTLRVVGAQVHVDERPVELAGELDDEPRAVVVVAVHGVHLAAVDGGRQQFLGLDRLGIENDRPHAARRGTRRDGVAEVARRRTRERVAAELGGLGGGDGDDAVLERVRRVRVVELQEELADPERAREPRRADERRPARPAGCVCGRGHRQQRLVAPERARPGRDLLAADRLARRRPSRRPARADRSSAGRSRSRSRGTPTRRCGTGACRRSPSDRPFGRRADGGRVLREDTGRVPRLGRRPARPRGAASSSSGTSSTSSRFSTSTTIVSPSRTCAIGPPRNASGATCPTINPWVAPEKRPSVISATSSPSPSPTSDAVTCSISRIPGPPAGPS